MTASDGQGHVMIPVTVPVPATKPMTTLDVPIMDNETLTELQKRQIQWFFTLSENWDKMPEEVKDAHILMQRKFTASGGGMYSLTPPQALMVVRYCREKGIGVHGDGWFFDAKNFRVNSTVSGLREEARYRKLDLGAPVLKPITRPWPTGKPRIPGFDSGDEPGYHCEIIVGGKGAPASCDVWLTTAYQDKSPVWRANPDHMLQVRAIGTCTKFAMGSGISQMPEDLDEKEEK